MGLVDIDAVLDLFGIEDSDIYAKWTINDAVYDGTLKIYTPPKIGKWIAVDSFSAFGGDEATWEVHGNPVAYYYCSVCKEQNYVDEFGDPILSKYCPECGAKMEGGNE